MGTHPIFESDFDCLTERARLYKIPTREDILHILGRLYT